MIARKHYAIQGRKRVRVSKNHPDAVLVSSELLYANLHKNPKKAKLTHAPAIDIDLPCSLVESSTPGHFHLFIDVPMTWRRYRKMLKAMVNAGVVEPGYYRASMARKATMLRTGIKTDGDLPDGYDR